MVVVHGTWGRHSKVFFDDNNPKEPSYRNIRRFGSIVANKFGQPLELLSFGWSGFRTEGEERDKGGTFLAEYLDRAYKNTTRIILGHSHGNNLVNLATHHGSMKHNPVKLLVYFACPQRPEAKYRPKHFEQLVYFTSHDPIDRLGSIPEGLPKFVGVSGAALIGSAFISYKFSPQQSVTFQNLATSSWKISGMSAAAGVLQEGLHRINKESGLAPQDGKIIVCVDLKHNGKHPDHSDNFCSVNYLPEILDRLQCSHTDNYAKSGSFYLDLDMRQVKCPNNISDPIISLTVKKIGTTRKIENFTIIGEGKESFFMQKKALYDKQLAHAKS